MSRAARDENLDDLAAAAGTKVRRQQQRYETAMRRAAAPARNLAKLALAAVIGGTFALVAVQRLPRFGEPFEVPPPQSESVAMADLAAIGEMVYLFMLSQGRVPETLDDVNMPLALRSVAKNPDLSYAPSRDTFKLRYLLPQRQVEYDGASGTMQVKDVRR